MNAAFIYVFSHPCYSQISMSEGYLRQGIENTPTICTTGLPTDLKVVAQNVFIPIKCPNDQILNYNDDYGSMSYLIIAFHKLIFEVGVEALSFRGFFSLF